MDAFEKAKQEWESIVTGNQPKKASTSFPSGIEVCTGLPSTIDDIYLCGQEGAIDGPNGIVGWAGPTFVRYLGVVNP